MSSPNDYDCMRVPLLEKTLIVSLRCNFLNIENMKSIQVACIGKLGATQEIQELSCLVNSAVVLGAQFLISGKYVLDGLKTFCSVSAGSKHMKN